MPYFPHIPSALVAALATQFPERAADLDWTDREVMYRAGQVSVVRWLAAKLEEQEEAGSLSMEDF